MIQIYIDKEVENKAKDFYDDFSKKENKELKTIESRLEKLRDSLKPRKEKKYREYIQLLIDNYEAIQLAKPSEMRVWENRFDNILPKGKLNEKTPYKKKKFWEVIVQALRYSVLQEYDYPAYMKKENIKACTYCNSQYTLSIVSEYYDRKKKKKIKKTRPKYQIDHYLPKSKYPYLATSFFNLYPSCASCNNVKGDRKALFELYTEKKELIEFEYSINEDDILDNYLSNDINNIRVYVGPSNGDIRLKENHNEFFSIEGTVKEQNDIVEELLLKSKIYTPAYKKSLSNSLSSVFPDTSIIDRLIIGNYSESSDVHKRPFSKLTQDLAKQLGLLKNK